MFRSLIGHICACLTDVHGAKPNSSSFFTIRFRLYSVNFEKKIENIILSRRRVGQTVNERDIYIYTIFFSNGTKQYASNITTFFKYKNSLRIISNKNANTWRVSNKVVNRVYRLFGRIFSALNFVRLSIEITDTSISFTSYSTTFIEDLEKSITLLICSANLFTITCTIMLI